MNASWWVWGGSSWLTICIHRLAMTHRRGEILIHFGSLKIPWNRNRSRRVLGVVLSFARFAHDPVFNHQIYLVSHTFCENMSWQDEFYSNAQGGTGEDKDDDLQTGTSSVKGCCL